jgi:hypothetical protein
MKSRSHSATRVVLVTGVLAAGFYSLLASTGGGGGGPTAQQWWTGLSHSTVWGGFAVPNTSAPPPATNCFANTPPRVDPPAFWAAQPANITDHADAVGTTVWSSTDLTCPRAMEQVYRSVLVADLSDFYTKFPSGTAQVGNRISKATLQFNAIVMTSNTNPLGFPCDPFIGAVGKVNILHNAVIQTGANSNPVPVDTALQAGLIQASPPAGPFNGPTVLTAFPTPGDQAADLTLIGAAGTFANGSLVINDTGPGMHNVKIDVLKWVRGATNLNLPLIGFSIAGINEATITVTTPVQFACRNWIEPIELRVEFF